MISGRTEAAIVMIDDSKRLLKILRDLAVVLRYSCTSTCRPTLSRSSTGTTVLVEVHSTMVLVAVGFCLLL
jgi:hypothetical protein